jgi:hypothetical protein
MKAAFLIGPGAWLIAFMLLWEGRKRVLLFNLLGATVIAGVIISQAKGGQFPAGMMELLAGIGIWTLWGVGLAIYGARIHSKKINSGAANKAIAIDQAPAKKLRASFILMFCLIVMAIIYKLVTSFA